MSNPYVYSPSSYQPTPYSYSYYNQSPHSPFIPPATLYPSSPRSPSPYSNRPNTPRGVHFDDGYWSRPRTRSRPPSWHAGMPPSPMLTPSSPAFLHAPQTPFKDRRHSFGNPPQSPWSVPAFWSPWSYRPSYPFEIHPLLNGESPRPDFYFDLSSPSCAPLRMIGPGQSAVISVDELGELATYPPITRMRITHDSLPKWPIDLECNTSEYEDVFHSSAPPITLGDVLWAIHGALHTQISHRDWAELSLSEETSVARAYTRRCRSVPSAAQVEASQGVKRVDYLLEKYRFSGLVRAHDEDGFYQWKLMTWQR